MDSTYHPRLLDETVVLERDGMFTFFVPSKPDWVTVNTNGATLLGLCNGTHSLKDIHELIKHHQNADEALALLRELTEKNFFAPIFPPPYENKRHLLHSLHLNMTEQCNLRCIYCYAEERTKTVKKPLDVHTYHALIDDVYQLNPHTTVTCTGGEPLLNPLTFDVARYAQLKNLPTFLLTNGTLITPENVQLIADLFDTIRISIDGSCADVHDALRGVGSFDKALYGIALLKECGVTPMVAMTVTRRNMHDIPALAKRFGEYLTFQPLYQVGNARRENLEITGKEYFDALKNAENVEPYGDIARTMSTLRNSACGRCAIGDGEISISATGDVYPCHMLHEEQFYAGNIQHDSFRKIYNDSNILNEIRRLSVAQREGCRECPVRFLCCGACWARAYFEHGSILKADTFCEYEFLAFQEALLQP